jgi:hypothetical protein
MLRLATLLGAWSVRLQVPAPGVEGTEGLPSAGYASSKGGVSAAGAAGGEKTARRESRGFVGGRAATACGAEGWRGRAQGSTERRPPADLSPLGP